MAQALAVDPYAGAALTAAHALARAARAAALLTVLAGLGLNLLQFACAPLLRDLSFRLFLPLGYLALALAALLLARLIAAGRELKADNELFV